MVEDKDVVECDCTDFLYGRKYSLDEWHYSDEICPKKCRIIVMGILFLFFLICEGTVGFGENAPAYELLIMAILLGLLFEGNIWKNQIKIWCSVFYMNVVSAPIQTTFHLIERHVEYEWWEQYQDIIYESLFLLALLCLIFLISKNDRWKQIIEKLSVPYYIMGLALSFCAAALGSFVYVFGQDLPAGANDFIEIICLILREMIYLAVIVFIELNELRKQYQEESRLKSEHIEMLKEYYRSQEYHMQEMRKMHHDIQVHLTVVKDYLDEGKLEKASRYLEQIDIGVRKTNGKMIDVGNELVNAVLTRERDKFTPEISLCCRGHVSNEKKISDFDLCTILSNLVTNAREACEKLKKEEKVVTVDIKEYDGLIYLKVQNPVEWSIDVETMGRRSSKKDVEEHGYGLQNVKDVVRVNDGKIEFSVKEGVFSVDVIV